ncbi:MAG: permease [Pseudonocardiaceae bacterium]
MSAVGHALALAGSMTWEILWALILGFTLSAVVQAVVRKSTIVRLMGDDRPRTLAVASLLGAASWSCSYAAVALARSLFRKGANFTATMAFEIGSTNLVVKLGIIMALLMGWQFTAAEFVGGPIMIVLLAVLFRIFVRRELIDKAREQAERGIAGAMEGHAAMDMSVQGEGSFWRRLLSPRGCTSVSHVFVMEWAAILRDLLLGLLIAGAIGAWVPESFWRAFSSPTTRSSRRCGGRSSGRSWRSCRSSARSATSRWRQCCGTAGSASAAWSRSSSPTC